MQGKVAVALGFGNPPLPPLLLALCREEDQRFQATDTAQRRLEMQRKAEERKQEESERLRRAAAEQRHSRRVRELHTVWRHVACNVTVAAVQIFCVGMGCIVLFASGSADWLRVGMGCVVLFAFTCHKVPLPSYLYVWCCHLYLSRVLLPPVPVPRVLS